MFERADWTSFRTIEGLQQKAGVPASKLRCLALKELTDNALDTGAHVSVGTLPDRDGYFVEDQDGGIDGEPEEIARLFSISRPMISTKLLRLPTRGALGNGLRVVAGAVLASDGFLVVTTRNRRIELRPERDGSTTVVSVTPAISAPLSGRPVPEGDRPARRARVRVVRHTHSPAARRCAVRSLSVGGRVVRRAAGLRRSHPRPRVRLYAVGRIVLFAPTGSPMRPDEGLAGLARLVEVAASRASRSPIPSTRPTGAPRRPRCAARALGRCSRTRARRERLAGRAVRDDRECRRRHHRVFARARSDRGESRHLRVDPGRRSSAAAPAHGGPRSEAVRPRAGSTTTSRVRRHARSSALRLRASAVARDGLVGGARVGGVGVWPRWACSCPRGSGPATPWPGGTFAARRSSRPRWRCR